MDIGNNSKSKNQLNINIIHYIFLENKIYIHIYVCMYVYVCTCTIHPTSQVCSATQLLAAIPGLPIARVATISILSTNYFHLHKTKNGYIYINKIVFMTYTLKLSAWCISCSITMYREYMAARPTPRL